MENRKKLGILGFGVVLGLLISGALYFMIGQTHLGKSNIAKETTKQTQTTTSTVNQQLSKLKAENQQLKEKMDDSSFSNLTHTALKFFDVYYNYDQKEKTNKERQDLTQTLATQEVLEQLFPLTADGQTSDYGYIKSELDDCQVYEDTVNGSQLSALVVASYRAQAGTMARKAAKQVFEVTFDNTKKELTSVKDLGQLSDGL